MSEKELGERREGRRVGEKQRGRERQREERKRETEQRREFVLAHTSGSNISFLAVHITSESHSPILFNALFPAQVGTRFV